MSGILFHISMTYGRLMLYTDHVVGSEEDIDNLLHLPHACSALQQQNLPLKIESIERKALIIYTTVHHQSEESGSNVPCSIAKPYHCNYAIAITNEIQV